MLRVALAQFNACVGDLAGNVEAMGRLYEQAAGADADLLVFPEMAICGYPPEDLLFKKHFLKDNRLALERLAANCPDKTVIVGFAEGNNDDCFNSLAVLQNGSVIKTYRKCQLPNYGVFDEQRHFRPGGEPAIIKLDGLNIALTICEDIWNIELLEDFLKNATEIQIILNISASPFYMGRIDQRREMISRCARKFNCALAYCNLVGGQDELVFDGRSMFADSKGKIVAQAKAFAEDLLIAEVRHESGKPVQIKPIGPGGQGAAHGQTDVVAEVYQALVLGVSDYVRKNGFKKVVIGLSGGIDSSITAEIAVAALGAENVTVVTMPSKFSSPETISDAERVAKNLGTELLTVPIGRILAESDQTLGTVAGWDNNGVAYENLQARIRGNILMSLSNQLGWMVLTTGNKSETAVGYSTLYGDTAGGFAVIKDVPKTLVYKLAEHINKANKREVIPASVIKRPPSAELRPGQKDTDTLPDYELLDKILEGYVEEDKSAQQLVQEGLDEDMVNRVVRMVDRNEYKRRQSPPGIKITPKAFGRDRRLPITNCYKNGAGTRD